jgi:hypothetical protein
VRSGSPAARPALIARPRGCVQIEQALGIRCFLRCSHRIGTACHRIAAHSFVTVTRGRPPTTRLRAARATAFAAEVSPAPAVKLHKVGRPPREATSALIPSRRTGFRLSRPVSHGKGAWDGAVPGSVPGGVPGKTRFCWCFWGAVPPLSRPLSQGPNDCPGGDGMVIPTRDRGVWDGSTALALHGVSFNFMRRMARSTELLEVPSICPAISLMERPCLKRIRISSS